MVDSLRLYRTIIEMLRNSKVRFHDMRCLITITLAGVLFLALWRYTTNRNQLVDPQLEDRIRRRESWGPLIMSGIFLLSIGVAFANADMAKLTWILVAFVRRFI